MTSFYLDTSALAKRYINEQGSGWIQSICDPVAGHQILVSRISTLNHKTHLLCVSRLFRRETAF